MRSGRASSAEKEKIRTDKIRKSCIEKPRGCFTPEGRKKALETRRCNGTLGHPNPMKSKTYEEYYGESKGLYLRKIRAIPMGLVAKKRWQEDREGMMKICRSHGDRGNHKVPHLAARGKKKPQMSLMLRELWKDPNYARRVLHRRSMSGPEKTFQFEYIDRYNLPFHFTGNVEKKSLVIGGKVPDFAHNDDKKLIEIWGNYWHKGQNPMSRISFFKEYGYDCLVLWASELTNAGLVLEKIKSLGTV